MSISLGAAGCVENKEPTPRDQGVTADSAASDAGVNPLDIGNINQPAYGAVAPNLSPPDAAIDAEIDAAPDPGPQPEYGAPPEGNE